METSEFVIQQPEQYKGNWRQKIFHNDKPLWIEVGMGKGQFLMHMAEKYKDINFVGIEKYSSVLLRGLEKRQEAELSNLYFLCINAENITEVFGENEIDRIYLNFSDPWPKDRHVKRRLTSGEYLERYECILKSDGWIEFKTDNQNLFTFSVESIKEAGWTLLLETRDLHHTPYAQGNVMTEYEQKFSSMGHPICKLIAKR